MLIMKKSKAMQKLTSIKILKCHKIIFLESTQNLMQMKEKQVIHLQKKVEIINIKIKDKMFKKCVKNRIDAIILELN